MGVVGLLHFCPLSQLAVISIPITLTVGDCSTASNSSPSLLCDSGVVVSSCKLNFYYNAFLLFIFYSLFVHIV